MISRVFFFMKKRVINPQANYMGRWKTNDNRELKAILSNMDYCGDALCGKPENYSKMIDTILKKK